MTIEEGTFIAAWADLANSGANIIVPAKSYDVREDKRLLIPFIKRMKIGFVNHQGEVVIDPSFDVIHGNCYYENEYIHVGITYSYAYERKNTHPEIYTRQKWGLINSSGRIVLEPKYSRITVDDNTFIVREAYGYQYQGKTALLSKKGDTIIPFGCYEDIDQFVDGMSRVRIFKNNNGKREEWCGIINEEGVVILDCKNRFIPPFYGKYYLRSIEFVKNLIRKENFSSYKKLFGYMGEEIPTPSRRQYGEFAGTYAQDVMGYDDNTINDAFEGDPDAYWNID